MTPSLAVGRAETRSYIVAKHEITPAQADEALDDPSAVIFDPDYNTASGESTRTIGYSSSKRALLTVITV